ncbi:Minor extracellular protease vpr [Mycena kentingensis (nom. inval.)]|nr:Minor extracellular protease vpr [Mycena kentingensis (nom. inval.)]
MKAALSFALLGATSAWAAKASLSNVKLGTNLPIASNKFIIEVEDASSLTKRDAPPHEYLYRALKSRDVAFDVNKEFDSPGIFTGAAVTLSNDKDVASVLAVPGVIAVRPVRTYLRPRPVSLAKGTNPGDEGLPDALSTHVQTGVDKLHADGVFGKGIKIGIVDTGIDYLHPALGGGFGPGFKVVGGYDFVGDAYTGDSEPQPDEDPLDECAGHGTHVAGIIGADPNNQFNISGVAYEAELSAYRVFGCDGSVDDPIIVDAMLRAAADGNDIITLSLGGSDGWSESFSSTVASRLANSGKIVTIAAGNEGASGSWFTSSLGNGINVISVASADNTVIPLQTFTVSGATHDPILYYAIIPPPVDVPTALYATSNTTDVVDDACNPLPDSTPDLSDKVVLMRRGTCNFVTKLQNAADKGGKTFLIYDNGNGFGGIEVGDFKGYMIPQADGEFTSMATPYLAGASALLLQVKGKGAAVAKSARNLFESTAATVASSPSDDGPLQTASQQGAGLIQVYKAIHSETTISPAQLLLNDTAHFAGPQKFTVKNIGKKRKTYTLSHIPAGTAESIQANSGAPSLGPVPLNDAAAAVTFNQRTFTLAPGASHEVVAKISPPTGLDAKTYPVYSGFIHVQSGSEDVHATYLGLAASLKDKEIIDTTDIFFGAPTPLTTHWLAPTYLSSSGANSSGTTTLRLDLVPADTKIQPTLNPRGVAPFASSKKGGSFAKVPIVGTIVEQNYLSRNDESEESSSYTWQLTDTFANGAAIPTGAYKVLLRALRVTGDHTNENDYESWLSPVISVVAP